MDHPYIDEHNIVARYEMGKLSLDECARFEEHFVDCSRCLEQLETTQDFRHTLKAVAAEDRSQSHFSSAPASSPFWAASVWKPALIAAAACVVLFAVPGFLLIRQTRLARAELSQANTAAESWHRQYVAEQQASAELEKQLHDAQKTQQKGPQTGSSSASAELPMVASVFTLETVRGGEPISAEPVNQVVIARSSQWVVLSVDRGDLEDSQSYRASLTDSLGHVLWQLSNPQPVSSNAVGITVPAGLLRAGVYRLTLQGSSHHAVSSVSRIYPFRVKLTQ